MAAEQIGKNDNQQPEPHDEEEYPQDVHQEISISETFLKEEHGDPPLRASAATPKSHYLLRQTALFDLNQLFCSLIVTNPYRFPSRGTRNQPICLKKIRFRPVLRPDN